MVADQPDTTAANVKINRIEPLDLKRNLSGLLNTLIPNSLSLSVSFSLRVLARSPQDGIWKITGSGRSSSRLVPIHEKKIAKVLGLVLKVTIVLVAVPEGLPLAVTLTLAYSMRKMMAGFLHVKQWPLPLQYSVIRGGTLTLNQMAVVEAYACLKKVNNSDGEPDLSPMVSSLIIEGIAQNTTGNVYVPETGGDEEVTGSPTEKAILQWALKLGMNFEVARSQSSILHVFPFNSDQKRGGVVVKMT